MVEYGEALKVMQGGDAGLLSTVIMAIAATFALMWLSENRSGVRTAIDRSADWALPVFLLFANPAIGLAAGIAAFLSKFISSFGVRQAILLGALLRAPLLNDSLWYDEAFTAQLVSLNPDQWLTAVMSDVHPPLFYFLLGLWRVEAGGDAFMLRLPSFFLSLLSIYLIYRLVIDLRMRERAAGIAALLVATLPASIYYGAEARAYALLVVLVLIGLIAVIERRSCVAGAVIAALCFTHNVGFVYALILAAGCILYWKDRRFWIAPIIGLGLGALWLPVLIQQAQFVSDGYWAHFSPGTPFWTLTKMTIGVVGESFDLLLVFPVVGITTVALWQLRHWLATKQGWIWLALVFGVPAAMVVLSLLWNPTYVFRHFLPSMMLLTVAWAYVLDRSRLAVQIVASTVTVAVLALYVYGAPAARPDYRAMISESCVGAESLYATSINGAFILLHNDSLSRPVITWRGALDNGRTVDPGSLANFGIASGDISNLSGQTVCVMQIDVPLAHQSERAYVDLLLLTNPSPQGIRYHLDTWNDIYFHLLEVL